MESEIRTLARFAAGLDAAAIPADVLHTAEERVLDNISVAVAAADDALIEAVTGTYRGLGGTGGRASIWGHGGKAPLLTAVFINAMMCHLLESDDVHTRSKAHIGAAVIPAAWPLAESLGRSSAELLTAVVAGYEVEARIAMAFGVKEHRRAGWHVTATAGVFGAAAACGRLLGLDENKMTSALGLAGAQSFGNWAFLGDGSNCKILNPARAAASGCEAAYLAFSGLNGPEHILTAADGGLFSLMTDGARPELLTEGLGKKWEICFMDNKTYPCCRSTHCAIDSALLLSKRHGLRAEDIQSVQIKTYQIGWQQCAASPACLKPENPVEAKFSTPYCVAAALVKGRVTLDEFEPECVGDGEIRSLLARVTVEPDERFTEAYPEHWGCHTTIITKSGESFETEMPDASGSVHCPLTGEQATGKAVGMMARHCPEKAESVAKRLLCLSNYPKLPDLSAI